MCGEVVREWAVAGGVGGEQRGETAPVGVATDIDIHNVEVIGVLLRGHDDEGLGLVLTGGCLQRHAGQVDGEVDKGAHTALGNNQEWSHY